MKNIMISSLVILLLALTTSCEDELKNDFVDPSVYTPTGQIIPGMFSKMMSRTRTFKNDYAEFWWHAGNSGGMIGHMHLIMRHVRDAYDYFSDANTIEVFYTTQSLDAYYYGPNSDFRELAEMKVIYESMSESERKDNEIYFTLSKMCRAYRASKAVDLYNSVPYLEGLKGTEGNFFPKFDDPWEIYKSILDDLGAYSSQIEAQAKQMSSDARNTFVKQDIIFQGDANKWIELTNAIRLRLAVRVSGVQRDYAVQVIAEILKEGKLPQDDLLIPANLWVSKDGDHWKRGLKERDYAGFISPAIMNKMDKDLDHEYTPGIDDPRLPVLFLPNRDTLYMPISLHFGIGQDIYDEVTKENNEAYNYNSAYFYYNYFSDLDNYMKYNAYSVWNPATMIRNVEPWRVFTRAEVDFLLAEIALKELGSTSKSAGEHVSDGVTSSIDYWYHINSFSQWDKINDGNRFFLKPSKPDGSIIAQFASLIKSEYDNALSFDDKMEVIMGQKYVHLNIHDYLEVFCELRRTRHPKLPLMRFNDNMAIGPLVERYPYPSDVPATNLDGYFQVKSEDNFTTPIFWVPDQLKEESYFMKEYKDEYLYTKYPNVPSSFNP